MPDIFEILRGVIDDNRRSGVTSGQFCCWVRRSSTWGRMSAESLAGRIAYLDLTGIAVDEAAAAGVGADDLWVRGGYPLSLGAATDELSLQWAIGPGALLPRA